MLNAMAVARCYECSSCGGLVRETSRECHYCHSPIATVRCARCFMMNVPEALHCISCGAELGLMPVPAENSGELACPRCRGRVLDAFYNGEATLHDCGGCAGQFVRNDDLAVMIQRHELRQVGLPRSLRKENPLSQPITYVPCPTCQQLMMRRNFGGLSGVIVDVCAMHGTWFDAGELPRILTFVGSGGMVLARQRNAEEQRRKALAALSLEPPVPNTVTASFAFQPVTTEYDDFEAAVSAFVRWARRYLSRG